MTTATDLLTLTLPDGSVRNVAPGTTSLEIARSIGPRLGDAAIGAELDGQLVDLRQPLARGGSFRILTAKDPRAGELVRHSAEHVMADAVKRLWPEAEYDAGRQDHSEKFQYDFRFPRAFTPEDLEQIETTMREILAERATFERLEVSRDEAERLFREMGETLKVERLRDIPAGETITLYRHGRFTDLCRGPHVQNLGQVGAVKLLEAGAVYLRGDEQGERLQRIYGTAFSSKAELDRYVEQAEQARARDHRKLGPELDLFSFSPLAPAMPFFHPKGAVVYTQLIDYVRELLARGSYGEVLTPQVLSAELWKTSGHYANYRDNMFFTEVDEQQYAVKPMNCPTHCLIFATGLRSYRDLPIRYADFGRLHRYERSGVTTGLTRVRSFSQDDAHIFCREDQIEREVLDCVATIFEIYRTFAFSNVEIYLGTRPEKSVGAPDLWEKAEKALAAALDKEGIPYTVNPGDGAFYGPKIDFNVRDAIGRPWQLGTVQLDYQLPERFGLEYTAADGSQQRPVMVHRAMLGSLERFIGILIEHTGGAFPAWLAPVQAKVLPVSEKFEAYGREVGERLAAAGLRAEVDLDNEKLGYKIRRAQLQKVPYMLVVGGREAETATVSVRVRSGEDRGSMAVDAFVDAARECIRSRSLEL